MRQLVAFLGQGLVVEFARLLRVQREVELVHPAELEARLAERVVTGLRAGQPLGQVGGMGGELVGDDALAYVALVRQAQVVSGPRV